MVVGLYTQKTGTVVFLPGPPRAEELPGQSFQSSSLKVSKPVK